MNKILIVIWFTACINSTIFAQDVNIILQSTLTLKQKADSLLTLANKNKAQNNLVAMFTYLNASKPLIDELNDANTTLRYYAINAVYYDIKRNDQALINETKKALPFFEKANIPDLKRICLFSIAKGYRHQKLYDSAQKYFDLTENLQNEYNPYQNWYVYSEKARMYQDADNMKLAESYFDKAYQITKAKGIRMDHGVMLSYLLGFYSYAKMPEKYAVVMTEQIDFISKRKNPKQGASIHDVMYANLDKMPLEAKIQFLTKVKNTLLQQGDITNAAFTNSTISALYEDNNQPQLSLPYMKENMELTKAPNQLLNHYIYAKATYRILSKAGKQQDANLMFEYLFKLKDSIGNKEQQAKLQELEMVYQTEKKQREIVLLNSSNELKQKQIEVLHFRTQSDSLQMLREAEGRKALFKENLLKEFALQEQQKSNNLLIRQNILKDSIVESEQANNRLLENENSLKQLQLTKEQQLKEALSRENDLQTNQLAKKKQIAWLLTGGIGLLMLSAFSIFTLYQKQKKKNIVIQKQAANLEILMKEIHHRVKNNMQIVSSLLDLQSISIKDQHASDAVKEGKNRVQSMALIHQNLYTEDNLKGIKAKQYINNLLQNLCDSYNISNDKIKIHSNIEDLNLDVDTMIPIGLILNELLTNAFKYAFPQDAVHNANTTGVLEIALREENKQLQLSVKDNGPGFPLELDAKTTKSFGLRMIRAFAQKLKAVVEIKNDNGASIKINITKYAMA